MTYIKSHKTCQEHVEVMLLCDFHIHHHDNSINIYCLLYSLISIYAVSYISKINNILDYNFMYFV